MPRQDKDGAVRGENKTRVDWSDLFGQADTQGTGSWNWSALVPQDLVTGVMNEVNRHGDAISFATNSAHTAGSVTLLHGGDKPRRWVNSYDEAEAFLGELLAKYKALPIE